MKTTYAAAARRNGKARRERPRSTKVARAIQGR
jgi:hypothetical protein